MNTARTLLAAALLATGLTAAVSTSAAAACPPLPPAPAVSEREEVGVWLETGAAALACLEQEFSAVSDSLSHHEKAVRVAEMNTLTYRLQQVRLDSLAADRRTPIAQTAEMTALTGAAAR